MQFFVAVPLLEIIEFQNERAGYFSLLSYPGTHQYQGWMSSDFNPSIATRKVWVQDRVSSKQTEKNFGSNRNKPIQDLFRLCLGLFHETKNKRFRFVSVFRTYIKTTETNRTVSKQTETTLNFLLLSSWTNLRNSSKTKMVGRFSCSLSSPWTFPSTGWPKIISRISSKFKGTQEWEFFWLRFWILYYFIVSYA
jgi:hypothetical protein